MDITSQTSVAELYCAGCILQFSLEVQHNTSPNAQVLYMESSSHVESAIRALVTIACPTVLLAYLRIPVFLSQPAVHAIFNYHSLCRLVVLVDLIRYHPTISHRHRYCPLPQWSGTQLAVVQLTKTLPPSANT